MERRGKWQGCVVRVRVRSLQANKQTGSAPLTLLSHRSLPCSLMTILTAPVLRGVTCRLRLGCVDVCLGPGCSRSSYGGPCWFWLVVGRRAQVYLFLGTLLRCRRQKPVCWQVRNLLWSTQRTGEGKVMQMIASSSSRMCRKPKPFVDPFVFCRQIILYVCLII